MPNDRRGYIGQDKKGRHFARTTITDEKGKRRNIIRLAKDKTEARQILKTILRQLDEEGSRAIAVARLTFNDLADFYELHYLKPAQFVGGRKVAGLRDWKHARAFLKIFRAHFGRRLLREITYSEVRSFRSERLKAPTRRFARGGGEHVSFRPPAVWGVAEFGDVESEFGGCLI